MGGGETFGLVEASLDARSRRLFWIAAAKPLNQLGRGWKGCWAVDGRIIHGPRPTEDNTGLPAKNRLLGATEPAIVQGPSSEPHTAMPLSSDDVSRIADLARLDLSSAEQATMLAQINDFFSIVERMRAVDTSGVEPLYTPLAAVQDAGLRLRDDEVTETDQRERNQRNAPELQDGLFLVPRVIE
jgi:aspartyl-tRNA(Asn)/glutamyl-tRNA(Gln) amidotransferase subunit C